MFPGEGGGKGGDRQTEPASCAEDKFSERANVEEEKEEEGAWVGDGNLVGACRIYPLCSVLWQVLYRVE